MKYLIVVVWAVFLIGEAVAAEKQEIAKCAAKNSDAARLVCYDALARSLGVDKPKSTIVQGSGKWKLTVNRSPIDDSENVYLAVEAEEIVRSGYKTAKPMLYVRCAEKKTNVFLTWDLYLGLESTEMLTRFDGAKATTDTWSISTDNSAVFVQGSDIAFAKKMMVHEKLLAQVTPYGESPVMATFKIAGLSEAIKPLRKACGW
ncbi:MAG: type VI secretion protein [Nitrosomonadales bacterium]|nr:type VI secretion protein [Nitrosomonadales bacterium]